MGVADVRAFMGREILVGLSTHNPEQVEKGCQQGPDYIGMGPVYLTPTKENPDPVIGLDGLRKMVEKADKPAVAIGAIDKTNLREVLRTGARNFCSVRPLNETDKPEKALKLLLSIYQEEVLGA